MSLGYWLGSKGSKGAKGVKGEKGEKGAKKANSLGEGIYGGFDYGSVKEL